MKEQLHLTNRVIRHPGMNKAKTLDCADTALLRAPLVVSTFGVVRRKIMNMTGVEDLLSKVNYHVEPLLFQHLTTLADGCRVGQQRQVE